MPHPPVGSQCTTHGSMPHPPMEEGEGLLFPLRLLFCLQVLVLGNKVDLPNALRERDLIERMWVLKEKDPYMYQEHLRPYFLCLEVIVICKLLLYLHEERFPLCGGVALLINTIATSLWVGYQHGSNGIIFSYSYRLVEITTRNT